MLLCIRLRTFEENDLPGPWTKNWKNAEPTGIEIFCPLVWVAPWQGCQTRGTRAWPMKIWHLPSPPGCQPGRCPGQSWGTEFGFHFYPDGKNIAQAWHGKPPPAPTAPVVDPSKVSRFEWISALCSNLWLIRKRKIDLQKSLRSTCLHLPRECVKYLTWRLKTQAATIALGNIHLRPDTSTTITCLLIPTWTGKHANCHKNNNARKGSSMKQAMQFRLFCLFIAVRSQSLAWQLGVWISLTGPWLDSHGSLARRFDKDWSE